MKKTYWTAQATVIACRATRSPMMQRPHRQTPIVPAFLAATVLCASSMAMMAMAETGVPVIPSNPAIPADSAHAADTLPPLSTLRMVQDVQHLASEAFNGRQSGSPDDLRSAEWVADRFRSLGLQPAAPSLPLAGLRQPWMSPTSITVPTLSPAVTLAIAAGTIVTPLRIGTDFLPFLDSPSIDRTVPVAFVGYGLADPSNGYDDYRGLDVTGHVVLMLRGKPSWYAGHPSQQLKTRLARQHGAVAILTVSGPRLSTYEQRRGVGLAPLAYYSAQGAPSDDPENLPGAWLSVAAAEQVLARPGDDAPALADLQDQLNQRPVPRSKITGNEVRLQWELSRAQGTLYNVLGYLEGQDPKLRQETIIIGAHRDHFGRQAGLLFPGADDNASGTAVLLEVARALSSADARPKRSVLFLSFSGEEQGLLGSTAYVTTPSQPLASTTAMINIDHAGIGNGRLTVGVTGLEKSLVQQAAREVDLADQVDLYGFFPGGDHVPFKQAGVPTVTVVSGGAHPHFHQADDRADTIQPDVLQTAARLVLSVAQVVGNSTNVREQAGPPPAKPSH